MEKSELLDPVLTSTPFSHSPSIPHVYNTIAFDAKKVEMNHLKKLAVGEKNKDRLYQETSKEGKDFKTVDFYN